MKTYKVTMLTLADTAHSARSTWPEWQVEEYVDGMNYAIATFYGIFGQIRAHTFCQNMTEQEKQYNELTQKVVTEATSVTLH